MQWFKLIEYIYIYIYIYQCISYMILLVFGGIFIRQLNAKRNWYLTSSRHFFTSRRGIKTVFLVSSCFTLRAMQFFFEDPSKKLWPVKSNLRHFDILLINGAFNSSKEGKQWPIISPPPRAPPNSSEEIV